MNGLKFNNRATFDECFSTIYKFLEGNSWLIEEDSIGLEEDNHLDSVSYEEWTALFSSPFPKYSKIVNEDWNNILSFKLNGPNLASWVKTYQTSKNRVSHIVGFCDAYFLNVDASYWVVFTNNQDVLKTLKHNPNYERDCKINEFGSLL